MIINTVIKGSGNQKALSALIARDITTMEIPNDVTKIGSHSFHGCSELTNIVIPDSVITIENSAFEGCTKLNSVAIGNNVTSIGNRAFFNCLELTDITIPDAVTSIGNQAFNNCDKLTNLVIGNSVKTIGDNAFQYCRGLTSITIPDSVTKIGASAFQNCSELIAVTIGSNVINIGEHAFTSCVKLVGITCDAVNPPVISSTTFNNVPDNFLIYVPEESVNEYKAAPYWSDRADYIYGLTPLEYFEFEGHVTSSGEYRAVKARRTKNMPSHITLPYVYNGYIVKFVANQGFLDCDELTDVTIPHTITNIGDYAFQNCTGLIKVNISSALDSAGVGIFKNCSNLVNIIVDETNSQYASKDGNLYNKDFSSLLQYAPGKSETSFVIPNTVDYISESAFEGCSGLTSITIPDGVTSIGERAFYNCINLNEVLIPDTVKRIYKDILNNTSYYNNDSNWESDVLYNGKHLIAARGIILRDYQVKAETLTIAGSAFENMGRLTGIIIPDSVIYIGSRAFHSCTALRNVHLSNSISSIMENAFYKCSALTSITIPDSVKYIDYGAFGACASLTDIALGSHINHIYNYAFYSCGKLITITCNTTVPPVVTNNTFNGVPATCAIYVPAESVEAYKAAQYWSERAAYIQAIPEA